MADSKLTSILLSFHQSGQKDSSTSIGLIFGKPGSHRKPAIKAIPGDHPVLKLRASTDTALQLRMFLPTRYFYPLKRWNLKYDRLDERQGRHLVQTTSQPHGCQVITAGSLSFQLCRVVAILGFLWDRFDDRYVRGTSFHATRFVLLMGAVGLGFDRGLLELKDNSGLSCAWTVEGTQWHDDMAIFLCIRNARTRQ